jgi:gliding motility-associated-like protein
MLRKILLLLIAVFGVISAHAASITAKFTVSPASSLCQDSTFTFTNQSTYTGSGTVTYKWYFGDGATSTSTSPTHTYSASGGFTVKLVATTTDPSKDSTTTTVNVNPKPVPDFIVPAQICENTEFYFVDKSSVASGSIKTWFWKFGNGRTSTGQKSFVSYLTPGSFTVTLIVTSDKGCVDSVKKNIYITPRPKAIVSKIERCLDSSVFLDASSSQYDTIITNYRWQFDDGSADVSGSNLTTTSHTFSTSGKHTVTLIETGKYGCNDTLRIAATVYDKPKAVINWQNVCSDSVFYFYDQSSSIFSPIDFWRWDFGDNKTTAYTERKDTLSHIYDNPGTYTVKLTLQTAQGCVTNKTFSVDVHYPPKPKFTTKQTCQDTAIQFNNFSTVTGSTVAAYRWDFADTNDVANNFSTAANPKHYYKLPGTYKVKLIAWSAYGCKDSILQDVVVLPKPQANFTFTDNCQDSTYRFQDLSSVTGSSIVSWNWNFGDGSASSTLKNPTHVYTATGTYNVRLVAWAKTGCNDTIIKQITVYPLPVPDFTYNKTCSRDTIIFTDKSTISSGTNLNYAWSLGDGGISNGQSISYLYNLAGRYKVTLTVTSDKGCPVSVSKFITISPRPKASFDYFTACIGHNTVFVDKSTVDTPNNITGYLWTFGDGSASVTGKTVTHTYAGGGTFVVREIVFSASGCTDTMRQFINITPSPVAAYTFGNNCVDSALKFTDNSTIKSGTIVDWQWTFGDSTPVQKSTKNPTHKFSKSGTYSVQLVVVSDNGCRDSVTQTVTVYPDPKANFNYTTRCADSAVQFTDLSTIGSGNITAWFWDFNDGGGGTSTDQNPKHIFPKGGTYTVSLTSFSNQKCQGTKVQTIKVYPLPAADFQVNKACANNPSSFFDNTNSSDPIVQRIWYFGDGDTASKDIVQHVYKDSGHYVVTLVEQTSKGCVDTATQSIYISPLPIVQFFANGHCEGQEIEFTDSSWVPNGAITGWNWDFGDGGVTASTTPYINHTYPDTGTYNVVLTVTASTGCSTSKTMKLSIYPLPAASFTNDTACFASATHLKSTSTIAEGSINAFLWSFSDGSSTEGSDVYWVLPKQGANNVTLTIISDQGCTETVTQNVEVRAKPTADFTASPNPATIRNSTVHFTDNSKNAISWNWDFGDGYKVTDQSPQHTYAQDTAAYNVVLVVTNGLGCTDTMRQTVIVHQEFILDVPNAFSPNQNGINETWKPVGTGIANYELKVFDRWGQLVFHTTNFDESWNGRYMNTGAFVNDDVYKYIISVEDYAHQNIKKVTGFVTVVK